MYVGICMYVCMNECKFVSLFVCEFVCIYVDTIYNEVSKLVLMYASNKTI